MISERVKNDKGHRAQLKSVVAISVERQRPRPFTPTLVGYGTDRPVSNCGKAQRNINPHKSAKHIGKVLVPGALCDYDSATGPRAWCLVPST